MAKKKTETIDTAKKDNFVQKTNSLIQARLKMGAVEQKLFATLVSMVTPQDEDFREYVFKTSELAELMDIADGGSYIQNIHKSAHKLMNNIITFDTPETVMTVALLSSLETPKGKGIIKMTFHPFLKPYLLQIKGKETPYTKYRLENVLKLKGMYSIRLYELLKQYQEMRHREFKIDEFKKIMGIEGKKSYDTMPNLELRVIKPALAEINEHTDLYVTYKKIKEGVPIVAIRFEIEPKNGTRNIAEENIKFYKKNGDSRFDYIDEIREKTNYDSKLVNETQILELYEIAIEKTQLPMVSVDVYEYMKRHYEYAVDKKPKNFYAYLKSCISKDFNNIRAKMMDEILTGIK